MRPLQGYYWLVRTTVGARWWMLRYDLGTARYFLRYTLHALRGRVIVLDERTVDGPGGVTAVQLTIAPLPPPGAPPDAGAGPRGGRDERSATPGDPRYSSLILGVPRSAPPPRVAAPRDVAAARAAAPRR